MANLPRREISTSGTEVLVLSSYPFSLYIVPHFWVSDWYAHIYSSRKTASEHVATTWSI